MRPSTHCGPLSSVPVNPLPERSAVVIGAFLEGPVTGQTWFSGGESRLEREGESLQSARTGRGQRARRARLGAEKKRVGRLFCSGPDDGAPAFGVRAIYRRFPSSAGGRIASPCRFRDVHMTPLSRKRRTARATSRPKARAVSAVTSPPRHWHTESQWSWRGARPEAVLPTRQTSPSRVR